MAEYFTIKSDNYGYKRKRNKVKEPENMTASKTFPFFHFPQHFRLFPLLNFFNLFNMYSFTKIMQFSILFKNSRE